MAAAASMPPVPLWDDDTFLTEYDHHCRKLVKAFCCRYGINREDERDFLQAIYVKLLAIPQHDRFKGGAFVRTCINNKARDILRTRKVQQKHCLQMLDVVECEVPAPDSSRTEDLLSLLSPLQRQIVTYSVGLNGPATPIREVARLLSISLVVAQTELDAALALMRESMEAE